MKATVRPSDPLAWKQADADVHVATRSGEFAGFVEFDGIFYLVRDERAAEIGTFPTLDGAFRALEDAHAPERRLWTISFALRRMLRRRPWRVRA